MAQFQGVDSTVALGLGTPMYGSLYENDGSTAITVSSAGTYYGWVTATAGELSGITADTSDGTADHLTVPAGGGGDYEIELSCSFSATGGAVVQGAVFIDGVESVVRFNRKMGAGGDTGVVHASGIITLAAAEEVSFRVTSDDNGDTVTPIETNLKIVRITASEPASGMYGCLYEDNPSGTTITIAAKDTPVGWTTATAGTLEGITADTSDATADHLTIPSGGGGDYFCFHSASCNISENSQAIESAIYVDGVEQAETIARYQSGSTGADAYQNTGGSILTLAAAEEVSVRFQNITSTGNAIVYQCQLVIYRIGP